MQSGSPNIIMLQIQLTGVNSKQLFMQNAQSINMIWNQVYFAKYKREEFVKARDEDERCLS